MPGSGVADSDALMFDMVTPECGVAVAKANEADDRS